MFAGVHDLQTGVRWVHSKAQLADAMTKPLPPGILQKAMVEHQWQLVFDPSFTSARKRKKLEPEGAKGDISAKGLRHVRNRACQVQPPMSTKPC